jgi:hypothetical protein
MEDLVEERLVSGTGLLRIPDLDDPIYYWSVLIDVVRPPSRVFKSNRYSPPRQRYATITYNKEGYVLDELTMDYTRIRRDLILDSAAQTLLAVKCAYQGTLLSFANLATALGLPVISIDDFVKPMESLNLVPDALQIRCELDTALQVRLFKRLLITCNEDSVRQPRQPPPPPPLEPLPPGEPIGDISPPYDSEDTVTQPDPLDESPDPPPQFDFPIGEECETFLVTGSITTTSGTEQRSDKFFGIISKFEFNFGADVGSTRNAIIIESYGLAEFEGTPQPCLFFPVEQIFLGCDPQEYVSHTLDSIVPI